MYMVVYRGRFLQLFRSSNRADVEISRFMVFPGDTWLCWLSKFEASVTNPNVS